MGLQISKRKDHEKKKEIEERHQYIEEKKREIGEIKETWVGVTVGFCYWPASLVDGQRSTGRKARQQ